MNIQQVVNAPWTVSDKIRKLDEAGLERAEIARLLGKRYQHVRNVLEADRIKRPIRRREAAPSPEVHPLPGGAFRLEVNARGDLVIPKELLKQANLDAGDAAVIRLDQDRLTILSSAASLRHARELVRALAPAGVGLADSLIEDRRLESGRETSRG